MQWTVAIGVDTHKEVHVAVALDAFGAQLDSREITATLRATGACCAGRRSSGCPPSLLRGRAVTAQDLFASSSVPAVSVYECERPRRQERRRGKSDLIDAALAARRLLSGERLSLPRGGGRREDLRLLLLERRGAMQARNAALNQLSALLVTAPDHVRARLGALSGDRLAARPLGSGPARGRSTASCAGSAGVWSDSRARWRRPSVRSPRSSPRSRPRCSRNAASGRSAAPSCSSRAATPAE